MGAHLVVLDLLQIPYEKVILIILVVKNVNSVKGEASRGPRINVIFFLTDFSQLWYKHEMMMPFFYLKNKGFGPKFIYGCLHRTVFIKNLMFTA